MAGEPRRKRDVARDAVARPVAVVVFRVDPRKEAFECLLLELRLTAPHLVAKKRIHERQGLERDHGKPPADAETNPAYIFNARGVGYRMASPDGE